MPSFAYLLADGYLVFPLSFGHYEKYYYEHSSTRFCVVTTHDYTRFGYAPSSGISRSWHDSILKPLRNYQNVFSSTLFYKVYIPTRNVSGFHFFSHPPQQLLPSALFIFAIIIGQKYYLTMALVCIYLVANNNVPPFLCLLTGLNFQNTNSAFQNISSSKSHQACIPRRLHTSKTQASNLDLNSIVFALFLL